MTPSDCPIGFASLETVDRHYIENKHDHEQFREDLGELEKTVAVQAKDIQTILEGQARVEAALRSLEDHSAPKPMRWTTLIPIVIAVLLPSLSVIYQAGKFPDRGEFQWMMGRVTALEIRDAAQAAIIEALHDRLRGIGPP